MSNFRKDLEQAINFHNKESGSDTPDFILAEYLIDCLESFDKATKSRAEWYQPDLEEAPGVPSPADPEA